MKAAAAERVAASPQAFKDDSKVKDYQHRKTAALDKVNDMILKRRAGVSSTGSSSIFWRPINMFCLCHLLTPTHM
jgi:hypothetical protein